MKIKGYRHGSRSSSKGKIVKGCTCGGVYKIVMSDHYNLESICTICGKINERRPTMEVLFAWDKGRR